MDFLNYGSSKFSEPDSDYELVVLISRYVYCHFSRFEFI